jgi:hypothetical protein
MAVEYGVIDAPRMLLPLSSGPNADAPCKNAAFNGLRLVVTVWPSALKAELVGDELNALHSGPYGAHATSTELHALNHERARARAPGCTFDGALYLLAESEAYSTLKELKSADAQRRLDELARECRSGTVRFLAATHFDGLGHGGPLAVDGAAFHSRSMGRRCTGRRRPS